jgi:hypothetical protein
MAYPYSPLEVEAAFRLAGVWVNAITTGQGVLERDPITIQVGRGDWASTVDPARASFTLRDADGRWSPDNQGGANWPNFRRGVATRIGVALGSAYLAPTGVGADLASTPNASGLDITGDIEIRIDFRLESDLVDIAGTGLRARLAHRSGGLNGWDFSAYVALGKIVTSLTWFDSGGAGHTVTSEQATTAGLPWSLQHDRSALRVTLDVDNGASGHTVTFYTAPDIGGTWVQVGNPVVTAGTTSIKTSTATLRVAGNPADVVHIPLPGRCLNFQLRSGIGGTIQANPDFNQATGATSFTDSAGRVWTMGTGGRISNIRWRFHGELATAGVRWDLSGADVSAPIEAAGVFRRLRQGDRLLDSAYRRGVIRSAPNLVQYWPMEETGNRVTQFGAAVGRASMYVVVGGAAKAATNVDIPSSLALPVIGIQQWAAWPDSYPQTVGWQVRWMQSIPADGTGTDTPLLRVVTNDAEYQVRWQTDGAMAVAASRGGTQLYDSGMIGMGATGRPVRMHLGVRDSGGQVTIEFLAQPIDGTAGSGVTATNAFAGLASTVNLIHLNAAQALPPDTAFGHVTLQSAVTATTELAAALNAYNGERAARRVQRLCLEEGFAHRVKGNPDDTEPMGPQPPETLAALLQQCAAADGGILYEARESLAVAYRCRVHMQGQVALALDYIAGHVAKTIDLDRDDQHFSNDITVKTGTAAGRAVLADGSALSISEPPVGVGRYDTTYSANVIGPRAGDLAGWRLRQSAVDEPRVSSLHLQTNLPVVAASPTLTESILNLALGDLMSVAHPPGAALGVSLRQLVQGVRERIQMFGHELDLLTSPGSPWDLRLVDVDTRYDTAGSRLASAVSQGATSMSVETTLGPLWTTNGADLPFDVSVGGVRVTVTAISGSSSPQTFTVAAVSRALTSVTPVALADPTYYEL